MLTPRSSYFRRLHSHIYESGIEDWPAFGRTSDYLDNTSKQFDKILLYGLNLFINTWEYVAISVFSIIRIGLRLHDLGLAQRTKIADWEQSAALVTFMPRSPHWSYVVNCMFSPKAVQGRYTVSLDLSFLLHLADAVLSPLAHGGGCPLLHGPICNDFNVQQYYTESILNATDEKCGCPELSRLSSIICLGSR